MLDAYPESFDSYAKEEGFNDGIQRSRNSFHHWKVGHVKYSLSDMSPVSRARARTRSCAKASPVPITVTRTSEARATPLFVSTSPKSSILNEPIRSPLQFPDRVSPLSSLKTTLVVSVHTTASEPKATLNLKRKRIMSDNEDTGDIEGTPSPPVNQPRVSRATKSNPASKNQTKASQWFIIDDSLLYICFQAKAIPKKTIGRTNFAVPID